MKLIQQVTLFFVCIALSACASSNPATTVVSDPPETVDRVEPEEPVAEVESGKAPENWYHLDRQQSKYPGIGVEKSYSSWLKDKKPRQRVIVAVLDSGIDIDHEDLRDVIWTNGDEQAGNGVDDDGNGYVDDRHGWNFIGGADGENVEHDTFEVTREYVRLKSMYEEVDESNLSPEQKKEYAYYKEIEKAYREEVGKMQEMSASIDNVVELMEAARYIMTEKLGTSAYTIEQVKAFESDDEMVQQAKTILTYFDDQSIDDQDIADERERVQNYLDKGLNVDFDPRSIVGDNYEDVSEKMYGNQDVTGPDAFHGTHVAGIIAALRGNGVGMDGIAGNVEIMPVRVVPDGDERDKDVANGIRYAVDNGAHIINMSFGKNYSPHKSAVDEAVRYAYEKGVLLIHAAGNDGVNNDETSHFPLPPELEGSIEDANWIEVGASSWEDVPDLVASFSNYGSKSVDVFAPGVSMYSTVPGSEYDRADGTSMASPVVSGLAALIMAYYPELSAAEIKEIILESAVSYSDKMVVQPGSEDQLVPFSSLSKTGAIVNAYEALKLAEERVQ